MKEYLILIFVVQYQVRTIQHEYNVLYTAYVNGTFLFVKNEISVLEILKVFSTFSKIFVLKPNKSNYAIVEMCALKEIRVALRSM